MKLTDLHPRDDGEKTPIKVKFIRHSSQTFDKDQITYHIQLLPDAEVDVPYYNEVFALRYGATYPCGLYVDLHDSKGKYNRWLVVNKANYWQSQFPTFHVLPCDFIFNWVKSGKKYAMPGVLRSQNSYNSGVWQDYIIETVEDQQKFIVPMNDEVETLFYNQRMLVDTTLHTDQADPRAWRISKINRISPKGLCMVTLKQDVFNQHTDVIERDADGCVVGMWADLNENPSSDDPIAETEDGIISCSGQNNLIKVGGSAKTLTVSFPNGDSPGQWNFTIDGSDATTLLSLEYPSLDTVKIKFIGSDDYIGSKLHVVNKSETHSASIILEVAGL